ncbi:hypothetical protein V8D89_009391 [Ganoderma adspersum]
MSEAREGADNQRQPCKIEIKDLALTRSGPDYQAVRIRCPPFADRSLLPHHPGTAVLLSSTIAIVEPSLTLHLERQQEPVNWGLLRRTAREDVRGNLNFHEWKDYGLADVRGHGVGLSVSQQLCHMLCLKPWQRRRELRQHWQRRAHRPIIVSPINPSSVDSGLIACRFRRCFIFDGLGGHDRVEGLPSTLKHPKQEQTQQRQAQRANNPLLPPLVSRATCAPTRSTGRPAAGASGRRHVRQPETVFTAEVFESSHRGLSPAKFGRYFVFDGLGEQAASESSVTATHFFDGLGEQCPNKSSKDGL